LGLFYSKSILFFLFSSYYDERSDTEFVYKESKFNPGAVYTPAEEEGSYEQRGNRVIKLGLNMYFNFSLIQSKRLIITTHSGGI
jgi:hypothetical protein